MYNALSPRSIFSGSFGLPVDKRTKNNLNMH